MMRSRRSLLRVALASCLALTLLYAPALPQLPQQNQNPPIDPLECMEAVAETRLLMDGLASPNYQALERTLTQQPKTDAQWQFARGQALLVAETGNLLLLRPPRNQGLAVWAGRAVELRESATALARSLAKRDFNQSRADLIVMANVCNRCHHNFRVRARMSPFQQQDKTRSID